MAQLWNATRRWDMLRVAASAMGLAIVLMVAAYGYSATDSRAKSGEILAALAAVGIAGTGLLYAWRLGAGGLVD